MEYITWIQTSWEHILAIFGSVVATASMIVKYTPTNKDNIVVDKLITILNFLALNKSIKTN